MCMRCAEISRRSLLVGGGLVAASMTTGVAHARIRPSDMTPLIGPGFRPTDEDEKGIWQLMDRAEEEIAGSNLLVKDPELIILFAGHHRQRRRAGGQGHAHLSGARSRLQRDDVSFRFFSDFHRVAAADAERSAACRRDRARVRPFPPPAHDPVLARPAEEDRPVCDRRHGRGRRRGGGGVYLGDYVQLAQLGTILSLFSYSRAMEAEADAMGVRLISEAGYPPIEMANVGIS